MSCPYQNTCGGCSLRCLEPETYYETKTKALQNILARIQQNNVICRPLIHIPDGKRRRAELTFTYKKGKLLFGFHAEKTHDIVDIFSCPALEPSLNVLLSDVRKFLIELCQIKTSKKIKNKIITNNIQNGDIFLTAAENGTDILIETDTDLSLEQRLCISGYSCSPQAPTNEKYGNHFRKSVPLHLHRFISDTHSLRNIFAGFQRRRNSAD